MFFFATGKMYYERQKLTIIGVKRTKYRNWTQRYVRLTADELLSLSSRRYVSTNRLYTPRIDKSWQRLVSDQIENNFLKAANDQLRALFRQMKNLLKRKDVESLLSKLISVFARFASTIRTPRTRRIVNNIINLIYSPANSKVNSLLYFRNIHTVTSARF